MSMGHPRVYGADHFPQKFHNFAIGSSPCIRGGLYSGMKMTGNGRFIPVYTGRILPNVLYLIYDKVHPRVYGADTKFLKNLCG